MKNSIKILLLFALLTVILYPTVKKSTESQEFKLALSNYEADEQGFLHKTRQYFRYVPEFRKNIEIKEVYRNQKLQLFRIDDLFISVPSFGFYVYEKGTISELKDQNVLRKQIQQLDLSWQEIINKRKYYELMVDVDEFNRVFGKQPIVFQMDRFCELFLSSNAEETFEYLRDSKQVKVLLKEWPESNGMLHDEDPVLGDFDFLDSLAPNERALWTYDMGVNIFSFQFDKDGTLINCVIEFKGNLGNEVVHL